MRFRRVLIITVIAIVGFVALAPSVVQLVARHYINSAQVRLEEKGIKLSVSGLEGHLLGVTASSVEVWFPVRVGPRGFALPVGLSLSNVKASLGLAFAPRVRVLGDAYGGRFDVTIRNLQASEGPILLGQLEEIDLGAHPQLNALGLSRAVTSLTLEDTRVPFDERTATQGELRVIEGRFSLSPKLIELAGGDLEQIASLVKVREISNATLRAEGSMKDGVVSLRPLSLTSSLGEISGQARGTVGNGRQAPSLSATLRITLSDETRHLQDWLPLLSQNTLSAETERFTANISSTPCESATVPTLRVGGMCLRSTLTR